MLTASAIRSTASRLALLNSTTRAVATSCSKWSGTLASRSQVSHEPTKNLVDEAYKAKYRGQGTALRQVISPSVRDYTMKVILD